MIGGFISAVRMLTIIPVPGRDAETLSDALYWFPVVGLLLGGTLWGVAVLFCLLTPTWSLGSAGVVIVAGSVLTLFLHLDGLADWADGFFGAGERERTLRIMKDSCAGTFGVVALVLVLLLKWLSVARMIECDALHWLVSAYVISRTLQVDLAAALPYARAEGGTAAPFVRDAHIRHRVVAMVVAVGLVLIVSGPAGVLALGAAWLISRVLAMWFRRRIGGITGDLLGAASEIIETGVLFTGAIVGKNVCMWCL
ncbi:MAG: adenosylcobinamide-GDP ribazoletransferase [Sedimentisphaerales bacterium]|nr:adenosylcobinamide-GDP ribazoletransferase [Sedimentisphaerales bacterium]